MNVLENFRDLFLEIWQQGIAGVNFTQIGLAIAIFLFFLLLRGLIAKFILQRLKNYVAKTSNKFLKFSNTFILISIISTALLRD